MTTKQYFHVFTKCLTPGATWGHEISLDTKSDAQCEADDLRDSVRVKVIKGPGDSDWILAKVAELNADKPAKPAAAITKSAEGIYQAAHPLTGVVLATAYRRVDRELGGYVWQVYDNHNPRQWRFDSEDERDVPKLLRKCAKQYL